MIAFLLSTIYFYIHFILFSTLKWHFGVLSNKDITKKIVASFEAMDQTYMSKKNQNKEDKSANRLLYVMVMDV